MKRTKMATYVTLITGPLNDNWIFFRFDRGMALVDQETGQRYLIKDVEDYILDRYFWICDSKGKQVSITLVFPPLPKKVKMVDLIEPDSPARQWTSGIGYKFYDLSVSELCAY